MNKPTAKLIRFINSEYRIELQFLIKNKDTTDIEYCKLLNLNHYMIKKKQCLY